MCDILEMCQDNSFKYSCYKRTKGGNSVRCVDLLSCSNCIYIYITL